MMNDDIVKRLQARLDALAAYLEALSKDMGDQAAALEAFRNADAKDWEHLDRMLGHSGHGKFWREVFKEFRASNLMKL